MEKNHKNPHFWSDLPQDVVVLVFKRLGFADFQRAKSVCSSWHSASREAVPENKVPWLILFPKFITKDACLTLFNPEEKDRLYKTHPITVEFAKSTCAATYGSWLLMYDHMCNLYIVNLFTQEKINLPPMESQLGMKKVKQTFNGMFTISDHNNNVRSFNFYSIRSPVFWIDEKTKEYIVLCALDYWCVVYSKKGDDVWNQIPKLSDCYCMIYKDHKLYFTSNRFSLPGSFTIFDFSGNFPQQTFECSMLPITSGFGYGIFRLGDPVRISSAMFVVTVTGDVLKVERVMLTESRVASFRIFKIYSSGNFKKYERVYSLGDETMLLDLGITVLANKTEGLTRNSIYFSCYDWYIEELFIFNLETQKLEELHKFDFPRFLTSGSERWFVPSFTHT